MKTLEIGTVGVEIASGIKYIHEVYYVPKADKNLFNISQLNDNDYAILFKNRQCTIFDPISVKLLTFKMRNKFYPMTLLDNDHQAFYSESDASELWHKRVEHVNYTSLLTMS